MINIKDQRYERFRDYFKDVSEAEKSRNDKNSKQLESITIPQNVQGKTEFSARLRSLVESEWKARGSKVQVGRKAFIEGTKPAEREFDDAIYQDDLEKILVSFDAIMPDPTDSNFNEFVKARMYGVIRAMQMMVRIHSLQKKH
jgi:hypothetical protein